MIPTGIDSIAWMQELARNMDGLQRRREIESALDDLEYLMDALDPEMQEPAYQLVETLRRKLQQAPE